MNLDKKLTLKKQELETTKKENMKKLSIKEKELEATEKENVNFNKKLTSKEQNYEELQTKIKDLTKKIESLEKEVKILDKQRIKDKERKQVILKLKQAYKELSESCAEQEKIEKETKEHQEIIEEADQSLNDNEEFGYDEKENLVEPFNYYLKKEQNKLSLYNNHFQYYCLQKNLTTDTGLHPFCNYPEINDSFDQKDNEKLQFTHRLSENNNSISKAINNVKSESVKKSYPLEINNKKYFNQW
ncbi:19779_t:CDS:2 [Gigaspora margarita]|uniref:19779_t:CDS:1 n=1 Tax=Gigaspora margarita TaxID=4874 RepID=A0ABM8VYG9_GIGMA|nr:19779_t:CDS:2 [Gigaspora margarita]